MCKTFLMSTVFKVVKNIWEFGHNWRNRDNLVETEEEINSLGEYKLYMYGLLLKRQTEKL